MIRASKNPVAQFLRDERGTASVEFVLVVPFMLYLFIMAFESGMLMIRNVMLERALDITMREIRVNILPNPTFAEVKAKICERAVVFSSCTSTLVVNMETVDMDTWIMPAGSIPCMNRPVPIKPPEELYKNPTDPNEVVIVRACIQAKIIVANTFGYLGRMLPHDAQGRYWLTSVSAFVNEPS
ncbi:TadE/TadG family type IV pilus assembly protein [Neogemmobacter tilapiae]|uniref:TadE-like domain-containing protein n=1 Tax=Neogemmobacter tilapiae TaxID=875041 RepID=A0A918WKU5_9RHOB|nr:TadE/TadG family type IV pilus assembly protein [Gemmobacter tilapiae]GHC54757.1 hypothetical protein GCM10007315_17180 [Gemmobacter tilapiae]